MIRSGDLTERVTIQASSETINSLGEAVFAWSDVATVWASVEGVSSREALLAGRQDTSITHRVRLRHNSNLTHASRLVWRGRVLEIVSLLEYDHRTEHVAICQEAA